MLKSVTLDAGGVLLLPDPVALRFILGDFGAYPENATCWRAHFEMLRQLDDDPVPDWHEMGRLLASALGVLPQFQDEAGKAIVTEVYEGTAWVAAPGAAEALGRLAAAGYRLAVVSNTFQGGMEELLLRTGLCSVSGDFAPVAAVIDSHVVGVMKPDTRIFELALRALKASPAECVHVGDSVRYDVIGAQAAGMTAVHIDPLELCRAGDHTHARSFTAFVADLPGKAQD
ncbi:MAG: HAD family hydrolase [Acidimicrobiales bacterium]|jgi:putative hydrolase of the HAD superfamily